MNDSTPGWTMPPGWLPHGDVAYDGGWPIEYDFMRIDHRPRPPQASRWRERCGDQPAGSRGMSHSTTANNSALTASRPTLT